MLFTRLQIGVFLGIATFAWGVVYVFQGRQIAWADLAPFSTVLGVLVACALVLEHWLWRQGLVEGWLVQRPDLRGTWKVALRSDWTDPETGAPKPPIECYMGVVQSLSRLQMHLMTPESESWLVASNISISPSGSGYQVVAVYTNKPKLHLRLRSSMHLGSFVLDTHGISKLRPDVLSAEYWTERKTTGNMAFGSKVSTIYTRFEDARAAFAR